MKKLDIARLRELLAPSLDDESRRLCSILAPLPDGPRNEFDYELHGALGAAINLRELTRSLLEAAERAEAMEKVVAALRKWDEAYIEFHRIDSDKVDRVADGASSVRGDDCRPRGPRRKERDVKNEDKMTSKERSQLRRTCENENSSRTRITKEAVLALLDDVERLEKELFLLRAVAEAARQWFRSSEPIHLGPQDANAMADLGAALFAATYEAVEKEAPHG